MAGVSRTDQLRPYELDPEKVIELLAQARTYISSKTNDGAKKLRREYEYSYSPQGDYDGTKLLENTFAYMQGLMDRIVATAKDKIVFLMHSDNPRIDYELTKSYAVAVMHDRLLVCRHTMIHADTVRFHQRKIEVGSFFIIQVFPFTADTVNRKQCSSALRDVMQPDFLSAGWMCTPVEGKRARQEREDYAFLHFVNSEWHEWEYAQIMGIRWSLGEGADSSIAEDLASYDNRGRKEALYMSQHKRAAPVSLIHKLDFDLLDKISGLSFGRGVDTECMLGFVLQWMATKSAGAQVQASETFVEDAKRLLYSNEPIDKAVSPTALRRLELTVEAMLLLDGYQLYRFDANGMGHLRRGTGTERVLQLPPKCWIFSKDSSPDSGRVLSLIVDHENGDNFICNAMPIAEKKIMELMDSQANKVWMQGRLCRLHVDEDVLSSIVQQARSALPSAKQQQESQAAAKQQKETPAADGRSNARLLSGLSPKQILDVSKQIRDAVASIPVLHLWDKQQRLPTLPSKAEDFVRSTYATDGLVDESCSFMMKFEWVEGNMHALLQLFSTICPWCRFIVAPMGKNNNAFILANDERKTPFFLGIEPDDGLLGTMTLRAKKSGKWPSEMQTTYCTCFDGRALARIARDMNGPRTHLPPFVVELATLPDFMHTYAPLQIPDGTYESWLSDSCRHNPVPAAGR